MNDKSRKKRIKKIQRETEKLRRTLKKIELRPCRNDADILKKEKEIDHLKKQIRALSKERDQYIYTWWDNKKVVYHGNVITEKFHKKNCKYYNWKNCTVIFHSRIEAIEKGYEPCSICKA